MAVSKRLRFEILRRDNHACRYCGRAAPSVELTVDHVIPETLGGTDDPDNLVAACGDCNGGKSSSFAGTLADVDQNTMRWAQVFRSRYGPSDLERFALDALETVDEKELELLLACTPVSAEAGPTAEYDRVVAAGFKAMAVLFHQIRSSRFVIRNLMESVPPDVLAASRQPIEFHDEGPDCTEEFGDVGQLLHDAGRVVRVFSQHRMNDFNRYVSADLRSDGLVGGDV